MANNNTDMFSLNELINNPQFDFIKTILNANPNRNNFDFSHSPYEDLSTTCVYVDEYDFHLNLKKKQKSFYTLPQRTKTPSKICRTKKYDIPYAY